MIPAAKAAIVCRTSLRSGQCHLRLEMAVRDEQRQGGAEQADEEDLSSEPGLELVLAVAVLPHVQSFRQIAATD